MNQTPTYTPEQTKRNLESFIRFLKKQHKVKPASLVMSATITVNIAASRVPLTQETVHNCGTCACIMGWAQLKQQWDTRDPQDASTVHNNIDIQTQAEKFGLNEQVYYNLCYGINISTHLWNELDIPIVIKCLRWIHKNHPSIQSAQQYKTPQELQPIINQLEGIISNELLKRSQKSLNLTKN